MISLIFIKMAYSGRIIGMMESGGIQEFYHFLILEYNFLDEEYFNNLGIDHVYSTDYKRTMQTALPFANSNELKINIYSPSKINYEDFLVTTTGNKVLIVGHSDTTPTFANELIKENVYPQMDDSNNSNLYIVSICGDEINHEVIKIN